MERNKPIKYGKTEYVDQDTGEILCYSDLKHDVIKKVKIEIIYNRSKNNEEFKTTRYIIERIAKQGELF